MVSPMTDNEEQWHQVGQAISERVDQLKVTLAEFCRASGISYKTVKGYIDGQPIKRADKERELTTALGWTRDSIDRLRRGEQARVLESVSVRLLLADGSVIEASGTPDPPAPHEIGDRARITVDLSTEQIDRLNTVGLATDEQFAVAKGAKGRASEVRKRPAKGPAPKPAAD